MSAVCSPGPRRTTHLDSTLTYDQLTEGFRYDPASQVTQILHQLTASSRVPSGVRKKTCCGVCQGWAPCSPRRSSRICQNSARSRAKKWRPEPAWHRSHETAAPSRGGGQAGVGGLMCEPRSTWRRWWPHGRTPSFVSFISGSVRQEKQRSWH